MKDDVVSYGLAVKLKAKGYPQVEKNTLAMYDEDGCISYLCPTLDANRDYYIFDDFDEDDCVCPTISQVLKWLREEKNIHIEIWYNTQYTAKKLKGFQFVVTPICENPQCETDLELYCDYETAAIKGIEYVIEKLI